MHCFPRRDTKHPGYDVVLVANMRKTGQFAADLLHFGVHAIVFGTAHQFAVRKKFFAVVRSAQLDRVSSRSGRTLMVSAGIFTFLNHPSYHRGSPRES